MKRFIKFILITVLVFLALGTVEYFLLRRERSREEEVGQDKEGPSAEAVKLEEITTESVVEDKDNYLLEINYPVTGSQKIDSNVNGFVQKEKHDFLSEVDQFFGGEEPPGGWPSWRYELMIVYQVFSPHPEIVSFKFDGYKFTGGAHGTGVIHTKSFDLATGQEYFLEDVFKEESGYLERLSQLSREQLKQADRLGEFYDENLVEPGTAPQKENFRHFVLGEGALTFYFEDYQVAPYAAGEQSVEFGYNQLKGLLKPPFNTL